MSAAILDWQEFCAARFPDRRRHDFEALSAYDVYRRLRVGEEPPAEEVGPTLEVREDEGGPAL